MSLRPYLGANVNPMSVEEMHHRGLLQEGETLLALFDGVLLDEHGRRVGGFALSDFVALTDQRVITWARGFFNDAVDGLPWEDVDVAEAETWDPFHGKVRLAMRLAPVAPRSRRISVKGVAESLGSTDERVFTNTLDYMPSDDVPVMAKMVGWIGDMITSGVTGEALFEAFAAEFPAPERPTPSIAPFQFGAEAPALPEPVVMEKPKRHWWQFGNDADEDGPSGETPESLVDAYERERGGGPISPSHAPLAPLSGGTTPPALLTEQPSMYDASRAVRLMLEFPRRLKGSIRRASQVVTGASELLDSAKDPDVRRVAMTNLRRVVDQHEADQGPLSPIAPVVRAVLRFGGASDRNQAEGQSNNRRIQVRASVHPRENGAVDETPEQAQSQNGVVKGAGPVVRAGAAIRRQVNLRRDESPQAPIPVVPEIVEPQAPMPSVQVSATVRRRGSMHHDEPPVSPVPEEPVETAPVVQTSATVRRQINLRTDESVASNGNGNGMHQNGHHTPNGENAVPEPPRVPVRRIVVNREESTEE